MVPVLVNGDYGADHSALSVTHLRALHDAGIFVRSLPLKEPVFVGLALDTQNSNEQSSFKVEQKARVSTTIETLAGPLRFRNVEFLVFEEPMPEVLLSRPVLLSIGFDLEKHLATVHDKYHDADFSDIGFRPKQVPHFGALASLLHHSQEALQADPDPSSDTDIDTELDLTLPTGLEMSGDTDVALR